MKTAPVKQSIPAYPLFNIDPYFSVWSPDENLALSDTMFWNGAKRFTYGLIHANGETCCFLGTLSGTNALIQESVSITSFSTDYVFSHKDYKLKVSFISPLPPNDLELLSCPVCYMTYSVDFVKTAPDDFSVSLILDESYCYNKTSMPVRGTAVKTAPYETGLMGLRRQMPLSQAGDSCSAERRHLSLLLRTNIFIKIQ